MKCCVGEETIWVWLQNNYVFWQWELMHLAWKKQYFLEDTGKHLWCPAIPNSQASEQVLSLHFPPAPAFVSKMRLSVVALGPGLGTRTQSDSSKDIHSSTGWIIGQ